ncbi:hypothetical protein WN944_027127 [Citrus x changshan-huyou]|uniref:Uncharacterized protein n=1 Tax=Citrus x changshan-huyou TaxID=2935761 RepID=A0AAP0LHD3_9ROSI
MADAFILVLIVVIRKLGKDYVGPNPQVDCSDNDCGSASNQKFPGFDQDGHELYVRPLSILILLVIASICVN